MIWSQEGNYSNGKRNGFWKNYDDKGNVKDSVYYKNDTIVDL
jgi:antitoxin component YwqK of YwqJK toxin-antitoxin module